MSELSGGEKLQKYLEDMEKKLSTGKGLKVGFLAGSTYPDGTPVSMVAATQEFGGSITIPERVQDLNFRYDERSGRVGQKFVKANKANFVQSVVIPAHIITIPSRPFFRTMIAEKSPSWGDDLAEIMKFSDFDAKKSLSIMGEKIVGQLKQSITDMNDPPNAASTVRDKGFDDPLIRSGHMQSSADYEVDE
ncbi:hypothetical protein ACQV2B_03005 [Pantoea allii]|uniref:hypothetical protein n=1 Tax=Pantoea allii TaxID=574096 RepID=UPI003D31ACC1